MIRSAHRVVPFGCLGGRGCTILRMRNDEPVSDHDGRIVVGANGMLQQLTADVVAVDTTNGILGEPHGATSEAGAAQSRSSLQAGRCATQFGIPGKALPPVIAPHCHVVE
jgi:hypothetical protein